jgi:hypothetical protein
VTCCWQEIATKVIVNAQKRVGAAQIRIGTMAIEQTPKPVQPPPDWDDLRTIVNRHIRLKAFALDEPTRQDLVSDVIAALFEKFNAGELIANPSGLAIEIANRKIQAHQTKHGRRRRAMVLLKVERPVGLIMGDATVVDNPLGRAILLATEIIERAIGRPLTDGDHTWLRNYSMTLERSAETSQRDGDARGIVIDLLRSLREARSALERAQEYAQTTPAVDAGGMPNAQALHLCSYLVQQALGLLVALQNGMSGGLLANQEQPVRSPENRHQDLQEALARGEERGVDATRPIDAMGLVLLDFEKVQNLGKRGLRPDFLGTGRKAKGKELAALALLISRELPDGVDDPTPELVIDKLRRALAARRRRFLKKGHAPRPT